MGDKYRNKGNEQKTGANIVDINQTRSIISLSANDLNTPIKRQRLSEHIKKQGQVYTIYKKPILNIKTDID